MPNMKNRINMQIKKAINPTKDNIIRTCNCIRKHQCPLKEKCLTIMSHTKQVSQKRRRFENKVALVKQHLSSDMRTIKKHSITSNTKLIQNYQTNIGILYQQTKLSGKFWEPTNHTTKVLTDVSYSQ